MRNAHGLHCAGRHQEPHARRSPTRKRAGLPCMRDLEPRHRHRDSARPHSRGDDSHVRRHDACPGFHIEPFSRASRRALHSNRVLAARRLGTRPGESRSANRVRRRWVRDDDAPGRPFRQTRRRPRIEEFHRLRRPQEHARRTRGHRRRPAAQSQRPNPPRPREHDHRREALPIPRGEVRHSRRRNRVRAR